MAKFRSSENCTDSTKLVNTCALHKYKNIPAKLDKKANVDDKIHFASADDFGIYGVNCKLASAGRKQKIVAAVDLSVKRTRIIQVANCITARENRGISNVQSIGNGVVIAITSEFLKRM